MGANKPVAPASLLQVGGAGRVVGKKSLELWERLWEPKIATLVNVHEHGRTLPLVAVGDNRIGKESSSIASAMSWRVSPLRSSYASLAGSLRSGFCIVRIKSTVTTLSLPEFKDSLGHFTSTAVP